MNKNRKRNYSQHNASTSQHQSSFINLKELCLIGYMSVDVNRHYYSNLSQLKFLNSYPKGPIKMDLNHNIDAAVKRTTDQNNEKIGLMLKFLLDKRISINISSSVPDFITYRRTLISIMCCTYGTPEPIHIIASYHKGSIYLCSVETPQEERRRSNRNEQEERFCAWGYKFEQYLLSDCPNSSPKFEKPVIENEEFSLYYTANLSGYQILYGAQIDGLLTTSVTSNVPETQEFETNVNYLKRNSFVELKTNREIHNFKQERNFKRYKLMRCWCQCYLAGLKGLLVGFRNDDGIVQRLQWYESGEIPRYCQNEWNPQKILEFLHYCLTKIKDSFLQHHSQEGPVALKFEINSDREIRVIGNCPKDEILPNWYTDVVT